MITNERQYKITRSQLELLTKAIEKFDLQEKIHQTGSEALAVAELEAIKSEVELLTIQINEYELLKSGVKSILKVSSLEELPKILIQARIAQKLSQKELASLLGIKEQQIQRYEAEDYRSASLKRLLEVAGILNLNVSGIGEINKPQEKKTSEMDWSKFPVKEMYRRGWFEGFTGSFTEAFQDNFELVQNFFGEIYRKPAIALHRKHVRVNSNLDDYSLLAWECRVLHLARKVSVRQYDQEMLTTEWITSLIHLSQYPDGPRRAQEKLKEVGIVLIIEPMLPNTYLDGAALLYGDKPVIGLTLRYDRIDNFWFVLMHEVFHVMKHLKKEKIDRIFDDLDTSDGEKIELEADELAGESLIPTAKWNMAIARFTRSVESINGFAQKLGVNPAIIAGRIRHDENNYTILNDSIGQGKVRNQFPEISFGI
ncbi:MAG: XRE family transcriptional regulator [Anaerolineaceae bacterium]